MTPKELGCAAAAAVSVNTWTTPKHAATYVREFMSKWWKNECGSDHDAADDDDNYELSGDDDDDEPKLVLKG